MYFTLSHRSKPVPTLLTFLKVLGFFSIFSAQLVSVSGRYVHNYLLYSDFNPEILKDQSSLEEWASVQGFWNSIQSDLKPHPEPKAGSPTYGASPTPTSPPVLNQHDLETLHRRDASSSANVCPISLQTTVYVAINGGSTLTVSSTVGSRPTGIPGDSGTSSGIDTTGGQSGTSSGGQSFGNKEGLITGLVIVLLILLASFCALFTYFYKKRRNARIQRISTEPGIVRRVGSKGLMSLSNSPRSFSRSRRWSPLAFFRGLIGRLRPSWRHDAERDSQSSELLERKLPMEQKDRRKNAARSVGNKFAAEPYYSEKHLGGQPAETRTSGNFLPEITPSPALSSLKLPSPPKPAARLSSGEYSPVDRRNSRGEPLSPRAWMAGFGLASRSHTDPFANPSYASSSGDHQDFVQSTSRASEPGTALSNASSSGSDQTPRGQQTPQRYNHERPDGATVPSDVRPDGASDIISTFGSAFGDRPSSDRTVSPTDDDGGLSTTQMVWYHPLSDVEEVLTPISDERLSMQPGSTPLTWRGTHDSFGQQQSERSAPISLSAVRRSRPLSQRTESDNPFSDNRTDPSLSSPPLSQARRLIQSRRESDVPSLLPSERSTSVSLTGTSIVDLGPPIDTGNWDDAIRRQEEDQLFYKRPGTAASSRRRF